MNATRKAIEREAWYTALREICPPGSVIYTATRHVSRSGMMRHIQVLVPEGNRIREITGLVAALCDFKRDRDSGWIKVGGCGFSAGFEVVYSLGHALWPNGFECVGKGCHSNDHSNGDRNYEPHRHKDGGYVFRHETL